MKAIKRMTVLSILGLLLFSSCEKGSMCISGEGAIVSKTLSVQNFQEIDFREAGRVVISQGATQEVRVEAKSNIINRLSTSVKGNRWEIDLESGCYKNYDLTIYITVLDIRKVVLSGSGNIQISDFEQEGNVELIISGSGDISFNAFSGINELKAIISGSGNISAGNEVQDVKATDIVISGSGNYNGFPVLALNSEVLISGSGNIETYASQSLDVKISGSGNVYYKGSPTVNSNISGSGTIIYRP